MSEVPQMKALRAHRRGGPEQLLLETVARPEATPGSVLVRVHAAAITFAELTWDETWLRNGEDRTPVIVSHEWSGVVEETDSSTGFSAGEQVYGMVPFDQDGAAAEYVCVPPDFIAPKPAGLTHVEAAALPLSGLTAWQALVDHAPVGAGQRVLVLGAAGGVGAFAAQLAAGLGARVTATATERDGDYLDSLGVAEVFLTSDRSSHPHELRPGSFDVVVDAVGGSLMPESMALVRQGGVFVALQQPPPAELLATLGIEGVFFVVGSTRAGLDHVRESVEQGQLRVTIAATYPLSEGRRAFESGALPGRTPGKTVLVVRDDVEVAS